MSGQRDHFGFSAEPAGALAAYWVDSWQRSVLLLDTLRRRGNIFHAQAAKLAPNVLSFDAEVILDGRTLPRPVNYALVRIRPPDGVAVDRTKRPFIVFDPRAGHGPGIGGMKQDSEIGVALRAGHPCYFVGFLTEPVDGQTIEDVCTAEAAFIEKVIALEPEAEGKPCLIGNCQAGWQIMLTAAIRPELPGPIILAGAPLSYWAGVRGRNPLRYLGGILGGTWLTALAGDVGHGKFDGANLVANFESMNPANTFWQKPYNVYAKVDTEPERFLDFETWWGSPVLLEAGEMQWIADNLFVGNRLTRGAITTSGGERVDLRNVASPIIVFCSWGDDITPPQQALGWLTDLYDDTDDLVRAGQTVVYTVHQTIGHLGIFVSGKVATKEHAEFASCIDLIDLLPPGLYEAVITEAGPDTARRDLIEGRYLLSLEPRTLDAIRALGGNEPEDEARFAAVARVSEINRGLYGTFAAPVVKAMTTEGTASFMRELHPHRLRFAAISDRNPFSGAIQRAAETARANRRPAAEDNPFRRIEEIVAGQIAFNLELFGKMRDAAVEQVFLGVYGNPFLQSLVGLRAEGAPERHRAERDVYREAEARAREIALERGMAEGTLLDAVLRAALYVARASGHGADERSFAALRAISAQIPKRMKVGVPAFKESLRRQYLTLRLDEGRAMKALPALVPADAAKRAFALEALSALMDSRDRLPEERKRFAEVATLFAPPGMAVTGRKPAA